jgi:hypothetical protein
MTWGIPTVVFLQLHVAFSLIGIATGFVALYGLLVNRFYAGWMAAFLATTVLTSVTGFPLPPFGMDPPRAVGILSLILLTISIASLYIFRLSGRWRLIYVFSAVASLYLNVFVAVVQAFQKLPFLQPLAPTQTEPVFLISQLVVLTTLAALGFVAATRFHASPQLPEDATA